MVPFRGSELMLYLVGCYNSSAEGVIILILEISTQCPRDVERLILGDVSAK